MMLRSMRRRLLGALTSLRPSRLDAQVDAEWYLQRYPDVAVARADPRKHFRHSGRAEGRSPNALAEQLDIAWYVRRYPDVAAAGVDPLVHFLLHGHPEGRFANARAEGRRAIAEESGAPGRSLVGPPAGVKMAPTDVADQFDSKWYLLRNPELAGGAVDPLEHYETVGRAEGRSPNAAMETREAWYGRFDQAWYVARNPDLGDYSNDPLAHYIHVGVAEGRAPNAGEEDRAKWSGVFDPKWYLARNPDVKATGVDPLEHFIVYGLLERRRPRADWPLPSRPVSDAELKLVKPSGLGREVALFVTHSPDGRIKPHVKPHLESLKREGITTVLIVASDSELTDIASLSAAADRLYHRANQGFDFAAWAHVLQEDQALFSSDILYLCNDSILGPIDAGQFAKLIARIRSSDADIVGLTENAGRGWHAQSYFLAFKRRIVCSAPFRAFILRVVSYRDKNDVINEYETQLTRHMIDQGFHCEILFPTPDQRDDTVLRWRDLLDRGLPYLKLSVLRGLHHGIDITGWRERVAAKGYDVRLADQTLAQLAGGPPTPTRFMAAEKASFRKQARAELHRFFADEDDLDLPGSEDPVLSVVVVLYNQAELTYACLKSLAETIDTPAEFIIIDNASTDETAYLLSRVQGARIVRNAGNLHFIRGANQGAAMARAPVLLFLNNDTRVEPGAFRYGLETLNGAADIGVVGAKLVLPNGVLQEAGSIIWNNGVCGAYGRGCRPDTPEFNFRREVDYCSGAFILVRRDLFERLGGFDVAYAPAYYEETDFCMRTRAAGFRVMYDPRVVVNHYEFGSSSCDAAALMQKNQHQFLTRHQAVLKRWHLPEGAPAYLSRSAGRRRSRLLMVEDLAPIAAYGAGFPRANALIWALAEAGYQVSYYPTRQAEADRQELWAHCPLDVEFILGEGRASLQDLIEQRAGYYDAMLVCRPGNMATIRNHFLHDPAPYREVALIYDAEAFCAPREILQRRLNGEPVTQAVQEAMFAEEVSLSEIADATLTVNERDARYFREAGRARVRVVGHSLDIKGGSKSFAERHDFLFVGRLDDDRSPNVDALCWFVEAIMPRLDDRIGKTYRLIVAGEARASRLARLRSDRVRLLGRVADLTACYDEARVFVAPTRYAAGLPHKVHEAAARGLPTVVTPLLAEQLGWLDQPATLVAAEPNQFAEQCARLYNDPNLWAATKSAALERVETECSPRAFKDSLIEELTVLGLHARRPMEAPPVEKLSPQTASSHLA